MIQVVVVAVVVLTCSIFSLIAALSDMLSQKPPLGAGPNHEQGTASLSTERGEEVRFPLRQFR